jgi:4-hydroxythreonine-4-phosphate dehydrogenase
MNDKMIKVGISQGDINGIGYELILKTLEDPRIFEFCIPVIYGSSKALAYHRKVLEFPSISINTINHAQDANMNRINVINCGNEEQTVEFSRPTKEGAEAAGKALEKALNDLNVGNIHVLLMSPASEDYTALIEEKSGKSKHALKIFVKDSFRIALATDKIPLSEIPASLTVEKLTKKIKLLHETLIHDFMLTTPRIAVLSLNPSSSEKENAGTEEKEIIVAALASASEAGICCFGPYPADCFFSSESYRKFDAVLAMYYDQALIPFRSITFDEGSCLLAGLPVIITAPNQDVSYELAGKNLSSEVSFRNALYLAADLFRNRKSDKEIFANPLRKQYFERGSDNEKLDLTKEEVS